MSASETVSTRFRPFADEQLQALEAQFGDIRVVTGKVPPLKRWAPVDAPPPEPPWQVVFRKPVIGELENFEGASHDDKAKKAALRMLARTLIVAISVGGEHVVHDGQRRGKSEEAVRTAWDRLREKHGAVHIASQHELQDLAGMLKEETGEE